MKLLYFPGCSLKNYAKRYEKSALAVGEHLGINFIELKRWNCCGVVYGLASDSLFHHIAAVRNLIRAQEQINEADEETLVTLCSMCYQVLASVNHRLSNDPAALETLNQFMDEEENYLGTIQVTHFAKILRDYVGFDKISEKVKRPLNGFNVAPYYGCMLVRPKEVAIDDPEEPTILEGLISSLGANPIDFPFRTECCGSYNVVTNKEVVKVRISRFVSPLLRNSADIIISVCPLCTFNLEYGMNLASRELHGKKIPVLYFTELIAYALGLDDALDKDILNILNNLREMKKE